MSACLLNHNKILELNQYQITENQLLTHNYHNLFQLYEFLILIEQRFQIYFTYDEIVKCSLITIKDFADLVHDKLSTYKMQPKL